jgi:hypothetical protein
MRDGTLRAKAIFFPLQLADSPARAIQRSAEANAQPVPRKLPAPLPDDSVPPTHRRGAPPPTSPPLHVHVERNAAGLAVWIGIAGDQEAAALRAAAVFDELRRTLRGTDRITQVVCNGTVLANTHRVHKETP